MAKKRMVAALGVIMTVFGFAFTGCATVLWNTPVLEDGSVSALEKVVKNAGGREIASYTVICGIPLGRSTFSGLVAAAARSGKSIDYFKKSYVVYQTITAYAR
jgi:hypothetical protein